jgi:hypothetical protein
MTHPVTHTITQGSILLLEVRLLRDNLAGATARIVTDPGIADPEIIPTITLPDTIVIAPPSTEHFALGIHRLRVWVDWPEGPPENVLEILLGVRARIEQDD